MSKPTQKFTIRVYAIILNDKQEVLLSDEFRMGMRMTKFPGGGLQFGEGTIDCLKREAMEEFGQEVEITGHFYTTDFFQKAIFYEDYQLISIYYCARFKEPIQFKISEIPFDFEEDTEGNQSFRWRRIDEMKENELSFPIDRKVVTLLKNKFNNLQPEHDS
jgi:8-oxo-dGTP pyrophosphatase MutT (NUDIX family)